MSNEKKAGKCPHTAKELCTKERLHRKCLGIPIDDKSSPCYGLDCYDCCPKCHRYCTEPPITDEDYYDLPEGPED